ncbi:non-ribosomal peptide synthetase/type I polyketide synthase [Ktedonosporobacter rubrisoli]|nr:non-ribosomal peptide synthetase [Ktedonosporobacter rubrisoli]
MKSDHTEKITQQEKRHLLLKALQEKAGANDVVHPLSLFQEGLFFLSQLQPENVQYNMPHSLRLRGTLRPEVLERSIQEIVRRHAPLRTLFTFSDAGEPQQVIQPFQPAKLRTIDLSFLSAAQAEQRARQIIQEESVHVFRLAKETPFRCLLLRLHEQEHWFFFVVHHLVFDLLSLEVFLKELEILYRAFLQGQTSPLPELALSYPGFARWQRQQLHSDEFAAQLAYWKEQLGGELPHLTLPTDFPWAAQSSEKGGLYTFSLPEELLGQLKVLARQEGTTLFMSLLACFAILLARYSQQDDLCIATPAAIRKRAEMVPLIGLLINTLILRLDLTGEPGFRDLLKRVKQTALDAYSRQDVPFSRIVEAVHPERMANSVSLFQTLFSVEDAPIPFALPDLTCTLHDHQHETAKTDLSLSIQEEASGLTAIFEYRSDLFQTATIERMAQHFTNLLTAIVAEPERPISTLPMLSQQELSTYTLAWNATLLDYPRHLLVPEMILQQARRTPEALAVVGTFHQLTYRELTTQAWQLAVQLQALGVGPNMLVGVCLERSPELIVAQLAILLAGGAYLPLDPTLPTQRLRWLLEDAGVIAVLTQKGLRARLAKEGLPVLSLDSSAQKESSQLEQIALPALALSQPEHLAYVIYTSGSTGVPKGVEITHANLAYITAAVQEIYHITAGERCSHMAGLGFDVSVMETWPPLTAGASLWLVDEQKRLSPSHLRDWLLHEQIAVSWVSTLVAEELLKLAWPAQAALRAMDTGGDALHLYPPAGLPFQLFNTYGPTEATVIATAALIEPGDPLDEHRQAPPIGRPLPNVHLYVLDRFQQPVPPGVVGELFIGGEGVARGYRGHPEWTSERFIELALPGLPVERVYRSGDLVRYRSDGQLEFLGRKDTQVKLRGFRIELGEIEASLLRHPALHEAIVLTHEITPGDFHLAAFLVAEREAAPSPADLRLFLQRSLPTYMLPTHYILIDSLPLTPGGKVDRRALAASLKAPSGASPARLDAPTQLSDTYLEQWLAALWGSLLASTDPVGLDENFFDLGGHSLLLLRVHEMIVKQTAIDIPLLDLFAYPTVRTLAGRLRELSAPGQDQSASAQEAQPASVPEQSETEIAIVGLAGRFPGANTLKEFWENLRTGVESISWFSRGELLEEGADPAELDHPDFVPAKGIIENADYFDAPLFGISPREAETLDPQQRILLECAWEALEHAGYNPESYPGRIGVYVGSSISTYLLNNLYHHKEQIKKVGMYQILLANNHDFLSTRLAYKLNLRGPAVTVQTACSTSLVAIHQACQSLLQGECELALAGGVSIQAPLKEGYLYQPGEIMSPDGHARAFDAQAGGTAAGTGAGLVVLKRLAQALRDGDTIHAIIKGSAINNDGAHKIGFTAPSSEGQAEAIERALSVAKVAPGSISYVEAHGTGTILGDPIEVRGLSKAFRARGEQAQGYCALGSVKTNIGHLDAAAGVAGLIKVVLMLQNKQLPPSLHFQQPNPKIDFAHSPFFVNTRLQPWQPREGLRRAGVNSLGVGGTNAYVILEEAPEEMRLEEGEQLPQLLVLSAQNQRSLQGNIQRLLEYVQQQGAALQLADLAYTLQVGRKAFSQRVALVGHSAEEFSQKLGKMRSQAGPRAETALERSPVFLFPGQGSQHVGMASELYRTQQLFRSQVDHCARLLEPVLGVDMRKILFAGDSERTVASQQLNETWLTQPALFVIEYGLARLWQSWGIVPRAMLGHSVGEYVAACLAEVFSLEDALNIIAIRGRLIQVCPRGTMLAVSLSEEEGRLWLSDEISLAAVNGPGRLFWLVQSPGLWKLPRN